MVSQITFQKSSAKHLATRRISQKCFVDLIFGHHRCPFLKIFSSLVQSRYRNITKLIYTIIGKKEEHDGNTNQWYKKMTFFGPKK